MADRQKIWGQLVLLYFLIYSGYGISAMPAWVLKNGLTVGGLDLSQFTTLSPLFWWHK